MALKIPDGWYLSKNEDAYKDFAPPEIPSEISELAAGKDGIVWTDPSTGKSYTKYGGNWHLNDPIENKSDTDINNRNKPVSEEISDREESSNLNLESDINEDSQEEKEEFNKNASYYTPEEENNLPDAPLSNALHKKLFNMSKGIIPEYTQDELDDYEYVVESFAEDEAQDLDKLNEIRERYKNEYNLPQRLTDSGFLWSSSFYKYMNSAIYNTEEAEDDEIVMAEQINEMLHTMPSYSYEDILNDWDKANEDSILSAKEGWMLPKGTLQRGESFSDEEKREQLLKFYEDGLDKEYILEPRLLATTALKELNAFLKTPTTKYIIQSKADGNGRGVAMDGFKEDLIESEILYPSYSPFKVLKVDRIKDDYAEIHLLEL